MGEAARIWTTVGANLAPLERGLAKAGALTDSFGRNFAAKMTANTKAMESFGKSWSRHISLPIAGTAAVATKMALDFQRQMTLISTSAGASAKDVKVLTNQVLALAQSGKVPYGPNELAKALYHLKSLGYDNATAMNTLKVAVKGAMAGNADLESTTSALGAAIRTNIKGTGDFNKAMATLNATVGAGNMRMEDMIAALGTGVLPAAKAAGLSLKDVGAAVATMTDEGMHADAAATRLRMAFSMLEAGSTSANKALGRIGLSTNQLGQMMQGPGGLVATIQLLRQHLSTLSGNDDIRRWAEQVDRGKMSLQQFEQIASRTEQFDVLSKAFGGGRTSAAILLLINNLNVLKQKYAQIADGVDTYNKKVKQAEQLDYNKIKSSWATIDASLVKLGARITPFVAKFSKGLASLTTWFDHLSSGSKKFLAIMAGGLMVGGPMLVFTAKLIKAMQTIQKLFVTEAATSAATAKKVGAGFEAQSVAAAGAAGSVGKSMAAEEAAILGVRTEATLLAKTLGFLATMGPIAIAISLIPGNKKGQQALDNAGAGFLGSLPVVGGLVQQGARFGSYIAGKTGLADEGADYDAEYRKQMASMPPAMRAALMRNNAKQQGMSMVSDYPGSVAAKRVALAAQIKKARTKLEHEASARLNSLMNGTYGSTDYTPPSMDDLFGAGSTKKHKTSAPKAKPVTNPIVAAAAEYLGVPYVWGGSTPKGFDCSGFIQYLYKKFGIELPRTSQEQFKVGKAIAPGNIKTGDVVFTPGSDGTKTSPGHVGLYIGGGKVEEAPHTGDKVKIVSYGAFTAGGLSGIRRYADFSGVERGKNGVGHFTNATSFVKLADPKQIAATTTTFKLMMREIDGLTGDEQKKAKTSMRKIGKSLVQVLTPGDLTTVKGKLKGVQKVLAAAVDHMKIVVDQKKQAFQAAWSRLAEAGTSALDKKLQSELTAIAAKYASGPAQKALTDFERQQQVSQLNSDLTDAQAAYTKALAGGDPQEIKDAAKQVQDAKDAITEDQLQQAADAEEKANEAAQQRDEDAANEKYDRLKQSFQDQVDAIQQGMEDGSIATDAGLSKITGLFTQFGIDMSSQGPVIAGTIYDSITAGLQGATTAANDLADALTRLGILQGVKTPPPSGSGGGSSSSTFGRAVIGKPIAMAAGAVVTHRPGGILAQIGEGNEDEVVAPLSSLASMTGPRVIRLTVQSVLDGRVVAENTYDHLLEKRSVVGPLGLG